MPAKASRCLVVLDGKVGRPLREGAKRLASRGRRSLFSTTFYLKFPVDTFSVDPRYHAD
jgi:hypothetical protein